MKTFLYGASDDLIEIDGEIREECSYHSISTFEASDGTKGTISYKGLWNITISEQGSLFDKKVNNVGDDNDHTEEECVEFPGYSDIIVLNSGIEWIKVNKETFTKI